MHRLRAGLCAFALAIACALLVAGCAGTRTVISDDCGGTSSCAMAVIQVGQLPSQARHTLDLIREGGPFPYPHNDGVVFGNREGLLPHEPSGYYHEYTVITPGSPDRGTRRIITGRGGERYYTDDHYGSFRRIEGAS